MLGIRLCSPPQFFFGLPPEFGGNALQLNNGTVTLLELNGRRLGITNSHVLDGYRARLEKDKRIVCQIGQRTIDPLAQLISESSDKRYDLAVLDLGDIDAKEFRGGPNVQCAYHVPREWPPRPPIAENFVMFGGFPGGARRNQRGEDGVEFGSVSSGGSRVSSAQNDVFTFQIEIDQCIISFDRDGRGFKDLPGISGCPVLMRRKVGGDLDVFDLVGIFFEYSEQLDVLRARPTTLLGPDGLILE